MPAEVDGEILNIYYILYEPGCTKLYTVREQLHRARWTAFCYYIAFV